MTTSQLVGTFRAIEAYEPATNSWATLPSMTMPRHGVAGAVIGNRFHLVSGMITSAGAMAMLDPKLEVHTGSHDVLELQFNPSPPSPATTANVAPSKSEPSKSAQSTGAPVETKVPAPTAASSGANAAAAPQKK